MGLETIAKSMVLKHLFFIIFASNRWYLSAPLLIAKSLRISYCGEIGPLFLNVVNIRFMFYNHFQVLIRRHRKKKSFTVLNIMGLSVGIAASLLIFLLIRYELSMDRFHSNRDRVYRVVCTETFSNGTSEYDGCSPIQLPDALRSEFPKIEQVAATMRIGALDFTLPSPDRGSEKRVRTADVYFVDPSLFKIFDFPWIAGIPSKALQEPYTAAITRSVAMDWFGRWQDALGKTIWLGDEHTSYRITGILEDVPANTDLQLKVVLSYATFRIMQGRNMTNPSDWDSFNTASQCFFLLGKGQSEHSLDAMVPAFVKKHFAPLYAASHVKDSCFFQPLREMHFNNKIGRYGKWGWSYSELISLALIGLFLLIVACINFINLSTGQSMNRSKEIGVRKLLGSSSSRLLQSFLEETSLLVAISLVAGFVLAALSLPYLNQLLEKHISLSVSDSSSLVLFLLLTWVAVTFLAGLYPGLILSGFDPLTAIKGNGLPNSVGGRQSLRRGLVVLQFVVAQILLIGTLVVMNQMIYLLNHSMGFDRKAIAILRLPNNPSNLVKYDYFKSKVLQIPGVRSASLCDAPPSTSGGWLETYLTFGNDPHNEDFEIEHRYADSDYLATFHIGLVTGRYPYPSDTIRETILNETAVKRLGVSAAAEIIGKTISLEGRPEKKIEIVGVLRDFNNMSLKEPIRPLAMFSAKKYFGVLAIRLSPMETASTISRIQETFAKEFPGQMFEAPFFDDTIAGYYDSEAIEAALFRIFAALSIFISCLGLYGLVSFMAMQKTKEVGIRKVLGATTSNIIYLFSREFTMLLGIAFLIAAPIGYYFMEQWLGSFYYHVQLDWQIFAITILLSVIIAWIAVGYRAIKAAVANPVKSLRTE
jgi:putative ABC transport system permease protein